MKTSPYSRNKKPLNSEMNVVPYIDVMLVLMVIFMVTAPMLTTGVDVNLPKEKTNNIPLNTQLPIIVSMTHTGELFVSFEDSQDVSVTEIELIETLSELQQKSKTEFNQDLQVMVNADQSDQYGNVMALMASLQQAGVGKVGLLTSSPNSSLKKK